MLAEAPSVASEILLLAKNPQDADLVREALSSQNISVVAECPNILNFLRREGEYANAPRPDLILLDLDLSKPEECEILTEIKKDPAFRRIPVIVMASTERYEDVFKAYDLRANAYVSKPEDPQELVRVVRATLNFWLAIVRLPKESRASI